MIDVLTIGLGGGTTLAGALVVAIGFGVVDVIGAMGAVVSRLASATLGISCVVSTGVVGVSASLTSMGGMGSGCVSSTSGGGKSLSVSVRTIIPDARTVTVAALLYPPVSRLRLCFPITTPQVEAEMLGYLRVPGEASDAE
jgi:hypothetical protein